MFLLTHISDQGTFTPVGGQGGFHGTPRENHFPTRILQWNLHHICTGYKKSQFCKKKFKCCSVSKWQPNNQFLFRVISILAKFLKKPLSQRNFSMKFGSKKENMNKFSLLKQHFLRSYFVSKWWPKQFFDIVQ